MNIDNRVLYIVFEGITQTNQLIRKQPFELTDSYNTWIDMVPFNFCWKLDPESTRTPPTLLAKLKSFDTLKKAPRGVILCHFYLDRVYKQCRSRMNNARMQDSNVRCTHF